MGRSPCCDKVGLKKGPWTPEEDEKLLAYIEEHGHGSWRALPARAGLRRCGKSCRLRWTNYLRPDIKRGKFNLQEEQTIIQLHALLGNRWSAIATHLPKRTDNEIKNYWNTHLQKRLAKMGIDPVTHKPKNDANLKNTSANLSHMAQWESARLEAEARLVRQSKLTPPPCLDILKPWNGVWTTESCHAAGRTMPPFVGISNYASLREEGTQESLIRVNDNENIDQRLPNRDRRSSDGGPESHIVDHGGLSIGSACGYYQDNKDYWNSILNLVNSSPSDLPMF